MARPSALSGMNGLVEAVDDTLVIVRGDGEPVASEYTVGGSAIVQYSYFTSNSVLTGPDAVIVVPAGVLAGGIRHRPGGIAGESPGNKPAAVDADPAVTEVREAGRNNSTGPVQSTHLQADDVTTK